VSEESAREKGGGGRPEFWEMVFWSTRKPLIGARCVIAGALLDSSVDPREFYTITRLFSKKVAHRENPRVPPSMRERLSKMRFLDPFAGFGSIPLEAVRLGIGEVVAVELLPTAYVFLKSVLEIPKWAVDKGLDDELIKDVGGWGGWVLEKLREDLDVKELYDPDVAVYIGTWEVKCPYCGKYTPLVGNWWLARVKGAEKYERLAWMQPAIINERVETQVIDLNKELRLKEIQARVSENTVETSKGTYRIPEANINAKVSLARCLHCNRVMPGKGDQWLVKEALREWNDKLEKYLNGEVSLEELKSSTARPRLLAKARIINKDLEFEPATTKDEEKLWKALEKLKTIWGDPDIPTEPIPTYENRRITPILGAEKWYQFFNPRQLLTLVKLVKLVREVGKRVEEEKLREGWSKEEAHKYAETITTYLAIALVRLVNFNSIVNTWYSGSLLTNKTQSSLSFRGIAMTWNWCDINTTYEEGNQYSITGNIGSIIRGLSYLFKAVASSSSSVRVLLDDATSLSKLGDEKFDIVVTDPPYMDDVPYAELSDFYYVWLKRALSDVENGVLKPRFYPEAFFECMDRECVSYAEVRTQWERFAPMEISVNLGRTEFFGRVRGVRAGSDEDFRERLGKAFMRMADLLRGNGSIITYYAHTDPSAWEALVDAGWRRAGLRVTAAYVIATESETRATARGKVALDASVVVVWRKEVGNAGLLHEVERRALEEASKRVEEAIRTKGATLDMNLFLRSLSAVLSVYTSHSKLVPEISTRELTERAFSLALRGLVEGVYKHAGLEKPLDPYASTYLVLKLITRAGGVSPGSRGRREEGYRRGRVDRSFASLLGVFSGLNVNSLIASGVLARGKNELELLEPEPDALTESAIRKALEVLLHEKGLDPSKPETFKTSIDILHYLELLAIQLTSDQFKKLFEDLELKNPRVSESVNLARVLYTVLPDKDSEKICCRRILHHLGLLRFGGSR
jgi:putative DNA methylase